LANRDVFPVIRLGLNAILKNSRSTLCIWRCVALYRILTWQKHTDYIGTQRLAKRPSASVGPFSRTHAKILFAQVLFARGFILLKRMLQESNARTRKGPCVVNASSFDGEVMRSATKAAYTVQCRPIDTLMMQHKKLSGFRNNEEMFHRQIEAPKKGPSSRTSCNPRYDNVKQVKSFRLSWKIIPQKSKVVMNHLHRFCIIRSLL
jgi:hypothetical protein